MATLRLLIVVQQQGAQATTAAVAGVGRAATGASKGVNLMRGALLGLGAGAAIRGLISAADSFTKVENRVRLTTGGTQEFAKSMKDVFNIAQETRQPLEATAILYSRLAVNTRDLGFSQQRLVGLVTDINKAVAVSGSTAQEARNGLIQLSQGFASGQLRGEEFRAVAEQLPFLLIAIADGLGRPIGELRKLAFTGQLTPEVVAKAIESQSKRIAAAFATMTPTIEQAGTIIRNSFEQFVGGLNNAVSGSTAFGAVTRVVANNIASIASVVIGATTALIAYAVAARAAAAAQLLLSATGPQLALVALVAAVALLTAAFVRFGITSTTIGGETISGFQRMGIVLDALLGTARRVFAPIGQFLVSLGSGVKTLVLNLTSGLGPAFNDLRKSVTLTFQGVLAAGKFTVNTLIGVFVGGVAAIIKAFQLIPAVLKGLPLGDALAQIKAQFLQSASQDFLGEAFNLGAEAAGVLGDGLRQLSNVYDGEFKTAQDAAIARTKLEREENEKKARQLRELEESLKGAGADASLDPTLGKGKKSDPAEAAAERLRKLEDSLLVSRTKQIEPLVAQIVKLQQQQALAAELETLSKGKADADLAIARAQEQIASIHGKITAAETTQENLMARISVAIERIRQVSPLYAADLERAALAAAATEGGLAKVNAALKPVATEAGNAADAIDEELLRSSEAFASQLSSSLVSGIRSAAQGDGFDVLALLADQFAAALEESIAGVLTTLTVEAKKLFEGLTAPNGALAGLGPTLGKAIGAAVGVAGLALDLFSRDSSSNVTNNLVKSAVESTQATRGVVAGPTSIPIFQLGEELEGANLGVIAAIDRVAAILLGQTTTAGQPLSLDDQAGTLLGTTSSSLF